MSSQQIPTNPNLPPNTQLLDVRPLLAAGQDPLEAILDRWKNLAPGACLLLHAHFQPRPLIALFSARGVQARPHADAPDDHWLLLGPKP